jgi:hypothetical protein
MGIQGLRDNNMGRYLLGATGIRVVVELKKEGVKTKKIINLEPSARLGYENLDKLAKFILQSDNATVGDILSAIKMARFIKLHSPDKVRQVWEKFVSKAHVEGSDKKPYEDGITVIGKELGIPQVEIDSVIKE